MISDIEHKTNKSGIIDVVTDFDYSTQPNDYNKHFIAWRRKKDNPYAFNYTYNKNENTFIYGQGMVRETPRENEKRTLHKILNVVGAALLVSVLIHFFIYNIFVQIANLMGVDVHNSFFRGAIYGDKTAVIMAMLLRDIGKLLIPWLILSKIFKLPKRVCRPMSLSDPMETLATFGVILMVGTFISKFDAYSEKSREVYTFFESSSNKENLWNEPLFWVWLVGDVVIVSIVRELLRMQVIVPLRQFGDLFAVIFTSIMTGLLTGNFHLVLGMSTVSIVTTTGVMRSGSILTAIFARILYRIYFVTFTMLNYSHSEYVMHWFSGCVFLFGLLLFAIPLGFDAKFRSRKFCAKYTGYLPTRQKLHLIVSNFPLMGMILCSLFIALSSYYI